MEELKTCNSCKILYLEKKGKKKSYMKKTKLFPGGRYINGVQILPGSHLLLQSYGL